MNSETEWKKQRKELAHRKRRMIFDNDGNEPVYYCKEPTAESLLECRTTPLIGSQVDTIMYCTWSSGFSYFTHDTKVGQLFTCTESNFSNNKTQEFIDQGTDPLEIMVDFCKKNDIEVFWSMRMNDTHDSATQWYGPLMFPQLKKDHPEWLIGSPEKKPKTGRWTAVDYSREEIRDLTFRFFEEVCENYDIDGVSVDFFRHLLYFPSHGFDGVATQDDLDAMTDLVARIREMTERVGKERGRPILISTRVPDSVDFCKAVGNLLCWLIC